jgi:glycosyltransferase involved in cell wall biosynthesis
MATYNGAPYVQQQIESILKQLRQGDELLISDDSSSDDTLKIIGTFKDERIKIYPNQNFRNPIFNFEYVLSKSDGEIVVLADQDDVWCDVKIDTILKNIKGVDLVLSDCTIIDEHNRVIADSFFQLNRSDAGIVKNLIKNSYLGCCMAMRKCVIEKALPFPKNIPMHDWWIGLVGEVFFRVKLIRQPLMSYRRHGVNVTSTGGSSKYSYLKRIKFRWILAKEISKLWLRHIVQK